MWSDTLEYALRTAWSKVSRLQGEEANFFFREFVNQCVRPEFHKKLLGSFDGKKPITGRFFRHATELDAEDLLQTIFKKPARNVNVTVLWGPLEKPIAFQLSGRACRFSDIFVTDADTIAKLSIGDLTKFVFFDGNREIAYVCSDDGNRKNC